MQQDEPQNSSFFLLRPRLRPCPDLDRERFRPPDTRFLSILVFPLEIEGRERLADDGGQTRFGTGELRVLLRGTNVLK